MLMISMISMINMPEIISGNQLPITKQGVEYYMKGTPMKKSPGPGDIVIEMIVSARDYGIDLPK